MFECVEDCGVGSSGYNKIRGYFCELGLEVAFDWFYDHNNGKSNPYHNNTHTFNVVELVKRYCDAENLSGRIKDALLLAALFHDFNHSGGKCSDEVNVKVAMDGLFKMFTVTKLNHPANKNYMLNLYRTVAKTMIYFTMYPYKELVYKKDDKMLAYMRVVREADILSYEHDKWKKYVYVGLCDELGKDKENKEGFTTLIEFHKKLIDEQIKLDFFLKFKDEHYPSFEKDVMGMME